MPNLIFFYLADHEILELSESKENSDHILTLLSLELRLLVLLAAMDDCVVLSPSHYREENICRKLVAQNLLFKEEGFLGLVMRETTLQDNKEKQADRYKDFEHIEKYRQAYLSKTDYGLSQLGFRILNKEFKTGKLTIDIWERKIRNTSFRIKYPQERLEELILRVRGDVEAPFIWERMKNILDSMDFDSNEERKLRIRASMSTSYIEAHQSGGISLPTGSLAIRNIILPQASEGNAYNLIRFRRVLQLVEVFHNIVNFNPRKILNLKAKAFRIIKAIRKDCEMGKSSEQVFENLNQNHFVKELQKMVDDVNFGDIKRSTEISKMQGMLQMFSSFSVESVLDDLKMVVRRRITTIKIPNELQIAKFPVGLFFIRGDRAGKGKELAEQVVSSYGYWSKDSGKYIDMVFFGWQKDDDDLEFNVEKFLHCRDQIESLSKWKYSGQTDLLLVNFVCPLNEEEQGHFDFSESIYLPVEEMIRKENTPNLDKLMHDIVQVAKKGWDDSHDQGIWEISDRIGWQKGRKAVWEVLKKKIMGEDWAKAYDDLEPFAVRDLSV